MSNIIVLGGWAIGTKIIEPVFGPQAVYVDVNRLMPALIIDGILIAGWKDKLRDLLFTKYPETITLAGWSTGAIAALAIAELVNPSRLILISATPSFCRKDGFRHGVRPVVLKNMIHSIKENQDTILNQFYKECGLKDNFFCDCDYSSDELISGLQFLQQASLLPLKPLQCPVFCFHGNNDKIIPVDAGRFLCEKIGGEWFEFDGQHVFFNKDSEKSKVKDIIFTERT